MKLIALIRFWHVIFERSTISCTCTIERLARVSLLS